MSEYLVNDSDLTAVASAIRTKGGTVASLTFPSGFVSAIDAIPIGGGAVMENDVNFFDYDGTLLYSYSATDALALTSLPENPTHAGLTAQGWNYTLEQMKAQVTAANACDIGQMYITTDEKTHIDIVVPQERTNPRLKLAVNGTVNINWGDNSEVDTMTGTSVTTLISQDHVYAAAGNYTISITVIEGNFAIIGDANNHILNGTVSGWPSLVYACFVRHIRIGKSCNIKKYAFSHCYNLETITIPNTIGTTIAEYAFQYNYSLKSLIIPNNITFIDQNAFSYCKTIQYISLPLALTEIALKAFQDCLNLERVIIPKDVTTLGSSQFLECFTLKQVSMPSGITNIGQNTFSNCKSLQSITIPSRVTTIENNAFNLCQGISSLSLPSALNTIGVSSFSYCQGVSEINLPTGISALPTSCISYCQTLLKLVIPATVTTIWPYAFSYCYGLSEIHFLGTTPPSISNSNAFTQLPYSCKIYVPTGYLNDYTTASNYPNPSTYTYIEE